MTQVTDSRAKPALTKMIDALANDAWLPLVARIMLAAIFLWSGVSKLSTYAGTSHHMVGAGVPDLLLPLVILTEICGAILLIVGWQTRLAAAALAVFSLLAAILFHKYWAVPEAQVRLQQIQFMKNIAIAGGMFYVVAYGAGIWSLDGRKAN